ncbi:MAG: hypothetical protein NZ874_10060, partial [Fimbriimonadales bacterium]|nr:hypothetical protein [Fimbriimonadales bacterium]
MRTARWGCLITIGLIILLIAGVAIWAYRSPRLEVPVRTYPPNNAYEHLATTAHRLSRALRSTPRLQALHARASDSRVPAPMSPADHAEYVRAVEPFLQGYRRYLDAPCKVVVDYSNPNTGAFSNGAAFRNLARVENYLIRSALARNQQAEAV